MPTENSEYVCVARVGEIPEGEGRAFVVGKRVVGVFQVDGQYFAIDDCCPHQGASLSAGYVEDGCVRCPWHAWDFQLKDGYWAENPGGKVKCDTFEVKVYNEQIFVKVS